MGHCVSPCLNSKESKIDENVCRVYFANHVRWVKRHALDLCILHVASCAVACNCACLGYFRGPNSIYMLLKIYKEKILKTGLKEENDTRQTMHPLPKQSKDETYIICRILLISSMVIGTISTHLECSKV